METGKLPGASRLVLVAAAAALLCGGAGAAAGHGEPAIKPIDRSASVDKPVDKPAGAVEQAVDKGSDRSVDKSRDKPVEKRVDKPVEKPVDKPLDRATERVPARPLPADPLTHVRDRLAEKLGAVKAPGSTGSTLRIVNNDPGDTVVAPAVAGRPAPRAAARPAPAVAAARAGGHWDYEGENGPAAWARLNPEFATCGSGARQSPIDIRGGLKLQLEPVGFDYKPSAFRVIDTGHTVQVNVGPGNTIDVGGRRFELQQFHFHRPSEERIDGRAFDMVAHLVHRSLDGRLAVVAVLLQAGSAHPLVQSVWNNLPLEKGDEVAARSTLDLSTLLPKERGYYTYMGSLTTPPCSEGVLWMVMKQPTEISPEQIGIFSRLYPMNARPVQPMANRLIKESQ